MRTINWWLSCFLIFIVSATASYAADEIRLTSGDFLVGEVKEINNEHIILDTSFAKGLKIEHKLISEIKTEQAVPIVFQDAQIIHAYIEKSENTQLSYTLNNKTIPLDINQIAANPAEVIAAAQTSKPKVEYSGKVNIGLSRSSGNEDDQDYYGALTAQARTGKNRYTVELSKTVEKNDGNKTQDETFGSLQYDRFINKKWYAFTSASFEEDLEEQLDLRSTFSLGSGYQFFEEKDLELKAEIGLAYVDEDFDDDDDNQYAGGRWAVDYEHAWFKWLSFFHDHEGFFSLEDSEDINIRSSSGFKFPLNQYINATLQANIDWNRSPAEGATGTDKEYIFSLGYEF